MSYSMQDIINAYERAKKEHGYISKNDYDVWAKENGLPRSPTLITYLNAHWSDLFPKTDSPLPHNVARRGKPVPRYKRTDYIQALVEAIEHFGHSNFSVQEYNGWASSNRRPSHTSILANTQMKWNEVKERARKIRLREEAMKKIYSQTEALEYLKCSKLTFVKYAELYEIYPFKIVGGERASIKLYWQDDLDILAEKMPKHGNRKNDKEDNNE
ncbi:hypothetical protein E2L07_05840 [Halalkalibacterium halodurans]|uniref:hypothetical protein n=1 Tax=Halalkalibacterium halodurans TaxID=86665 RepID=UPI0010677737|nr:hypothetical protein [Halalkalibacterium halodurans]TES56205.1 hypothetical protein E2L07_05840 [Halalkalibacterium halodurans]